VEAVHLQAAAVGHSGHGPDCGGRGGSPLMSDVELDVNVYLVWWWMFQERGSVALDNHAPCTSVAGGGENHGR